jgi:hypothetical protein
MKKSVDFTNGERGKHAGMDLKIAGASKTDWAVCIRKDAKELIPFKLYKIESFDRLAEVRVENEKGKIAYYPAEWFAILDVPRKTLGLLEKAV